MKRTINFSGFLLVAFASALLMMVWPMNADAQGWRRSVVKLCKNITKAELASGHYKHATASLVKKHAAEASAHRQLSNQKCGHISGLTVPQMIDTTSIKVNRQNASVKAKVSKKRASKKQVSQADLDRSKCEKLYILAVDALMNDNDKLFESYILRSSNAGFAPAQYAYAVISMMGIDGDDSRFTNLIRCSAEAGYGPACAYLSYGFYYGLPGFECDIDSAKVWAERSSNLGCCDGHAMAALYAMEDGDDVKAQTYLERIYSFDLRRDSLYKKFYYKEHSLDFSLCNFEDKYSNVKGYNAFLDNFNSIESCYDNLLLYRLSNALTKEDHKACRELAEYVAYNYDTAYSYLVLANYSMGNGDVITEDPMEVVMYLERASEELPFATATLGECYLSGYGVDRDSIYALSLFRDAAENGSPEAMYRLTYVYNDAGYYDYVRDWGTRPELADSMDIQYLVGYAYYKREEYKKAIDYFERAAEGGYVYGQWMAYVLYSQFLLDEDKAFEYMKEAAEGGYPDALNDLGVAYLKGDHVGRNVPKALQLFELAKDGGSLFANHNLGVMYYAKKSVYGMKSDRKRAAEYWRIGAEMGYANSMACYAECLIKGSCGVQKDKDSGYALMRKAAEAGSEYASAFLQAKKK